MVVSLCSSPTHSSRLRRCEDCVCTSSGTPDPGVSGWQWPPSRYRMVQGRRQTAGIGSERSQKRRVPGIPLCLCYLFVLSYFSSLLLSSCQLGSRIQRLAGGQYLEIQDVRPEDSGQYSCVVTNIAGSTSLFFTVEILCKLKGLSFLKKPNWFVTIWKLVQSIQKALNQCFHFWDTGKRRCLDGACVFRGMLH